MKILKSTSNRLIVFVLILFINLNLIAQGTDSDSAVWPKIIKTSEYVITLYSPEDASYIDNRLVSSLAFSYKDIWEEPVFGMLWVTTILDVDRTTRQASLASMKIDEIRLPNEISESNKLALEKLINDELPKWDIEFPLDDLLKDLDEVSVSIANLNNKPPKIIFSTEPTVLILIDGEPKLKKVEKGFELVQNTGAFIVKNSVSNEYYLKGGDFWYESKSALGPWETAENIPSKVKDIANKSESKSNESNDEKYDGKAPKIIIVQEPSELIIIGGEPKFSPLQNTNLLFVENSDSDIFMNINSQSYYILLSGRWFTSKDIKGEWNFVESEKLPEDFKKIAKDSKKSNVLSSVAGTLEAKEAVYDAQIPQTAAVKRTTKATDVSYNGSPEFKNVDGLKLQYAVNTESDVFKDNDTYYLCDNAVWFTSNKANGPWKVADDRPTEIEKIPADNPKYNTKYVYIYETSPTVVYVGYTPGYYGSYVNGSTVVYGSGFYYNPWYNDMYYHHHYSYGFSMRYNPYYGWSFGFGFGSPYYWYGYGYGGRGYHHWGPPYYRPPYYRPPYYGGNNRPRPSHPIYKDRGGINDFRRPSTMPSNEPSTRPSAQPSTRPSNPYIRPSQPSTRPSTQPSTRPSNPYIRPSQPSSRPSNIPNMRPSTRPSMPSYRPAPRPSSRPMAAPMNRPSAAPMRRN